MIRSLLFVVFYLVVSIGYSQGGYLGAKNGFEIELYGTPSFKKTYRLNGSGSTTTTRNRFAYISYAVAYTRVFDKNFEFNIKYRYAKARIPFYGSTYLVADTIYTSGDPQEISYKILNFLEDAGASLHFFTGGIKYYRLGSFAPVGKYIGLEFEYGFGSFSSTEDIYVGKGDIAKRDNIFFEKRDLLEIDTVHIPSDLKGTVNSFNFLIGRSYPVSDFLLFTVGMKFPIFSLISVDMYNDLGQGAQKSKPFNYSTMSSFSQIMRQGLGKFTRMTLNVGIKFTF
jgi:hypothetical protein